MEPKLPLVPRCCSLRCRAPPALHHMNPARLLCFLSVVVFASSAQAVEKWLYSPTNFLVNENVDKLEALWKRAAAAGYTHVLVTDSKFSKLGDMEGMPQY